MPKGEVEMGDEPELAAAAVIKTRAAAQRKAFGGPANSMKYGKMPKPLMNPNALKIGKKRKKKSY